MYTYTCSSLYIPHFMVRVMDTLGGMDRHRAGKTMCAPHGEGVKMDLDCITLTLETT